MTRVPASDIFTRRVCLQLDGMDAVAVRRDLAYGPANRDLRFDVYYPPDKPDDGRWPAVIIVAGYPGAKEPRPSTLSYKEIGWTVSTCQLIAVSGMVAIAYTNREPVSDLQALFAHVHECAGSLRIDPARVTVLAVSGNVPTALATVMRDASRTPTCAVFGYGCLLDLEDATDVADAARQFGFANPGVGRSLADLRRDVPLLITRAGRDQFAAMNASIDRFIRQGLTANLPITLVNHAEGPHAFDLFDDSRTSRDIVRQTLRFLQQHLTPERPGANVSYGSHPNAPIPRSNNQQGSSVRNSCRTVLATWHAMCPARDFETMVIDLRHLLRNLRRSPASAAAAVLTLSLTLGAGTAIFAVVDAVLLTPPPFADPDALVLVGEILPGEPATAPRAVTYRTLEAWRERAGPLAALEAADGTHLTLTGLGAAERVNVTDVTPGFLPLLGIAPARGRTFAADDLGQPVVILTHGLWHRKLAADPSAIGRQILLGGRPHTVVGVLPEQFVFPLDQVDMFRPLPLPPANAEARAGYRVGAIARLAENVSSRDLTAALDEVSGRSSPAAQVVARPIAARIARGSTRTLGLLAGAAALALVIAFANLAGLLLVRSVDRRRELAVRTALGARQSEIARQLLLEAGTLVGIGIAGGVLLALWLTPVVGRLALEPFGDLANREVAVSWRVLGVVAMVAAACAGLCGLLPASVPSRRNVVDALARGVTPAPRELGLRRMFATSVIALACVLLVSLTLVGRSLRHVLNVDPGFDPRGVLALSLLVQYPNDERVLFLSALHDAIEARLGARTVSVVNELPLTHDGGRRFMGIRPTDPTREVVLREAGTAYFDVMRIPILAGRPFDARDNASAPLRVVVSKSLADQWFPGEQPIGRQIRLSPGPQAPLAEIIGVAGDVKHRSLDTEGFWPTVYASAWQEPSGSMILVVRSQRPNADDVAVVREEVARLASDVPVQTVRSMEEVVAASPGVPARRVLTAAFAGFALLAIVLGGIGLFGVVAHDVASRRVELALRMALGADPTRILMRTLGQGAWMVAAGLAVGGVLSIWATGALSSMVFGAGRFDLLNVGVAAAVLIAVGAVAVLPAARRAARTDPLDALRSE